MELCKLVFQTWEKYGKYRLSLKKTCGTMVPLLTNVSRFVTMRIIEKHFCLFQCLSISKELDKIGIYSLKSFVSGHKGVTLINGKPC